MGVALECLSCSASTMLQTICAMFVFDCSIVRLLCAAEKQIFTLVFIASLQSPFILCDSRALPRMCFNIQGLHYARHCLARSPTHMAIWLWKVPGETPSRG